MPRTIYIAGNWKMNLLPDEAHELAEGIRVNLEPQKNVEVVLIPQIGLVPLITPLLENSTLKIGAQNASDKVSGAFTGETSPLLIKALGCDYCVVGHSERRQFFQETDQLVAHKARVLCQAQVSPIVCVGETLDEREANQHLEKIAKQIEAVYKILDLENWSKVILAYEPIWAIGTGKTASPDQANEIHRFIREKIAEYANDYLARTTSILYGGSAKPQNAKDLLEQPDVDGLLVGGASLQAEDFIQIIESCPRID